MNLKAREQIKSLLAQEDLMMKELAIELGKALNKSYTLDNLSKKLRNGSIPYNQVALIADILGYKIKFEKEE
ncbi:MAG: hypothetical protein PHX18_08270 [Candidatus Gastranaerophilales bacterium]|nr:hypothetical protein [Candidatus Gastranaerophilales bacterium]